MKMSDVKFNTRMTEGGPNIDETLTFVGTASISAVDCAVHQHDQLTAINQELVEALEASINYATSLPMEIDSPQSQIEAWKSLSALGPLELIKRAKELTK